MAHVPQTSPTCRLFDRIGAALAIDPQAAVDAVVGLFVDALLADDRVSHFFTSRGTDREKHVKHLAAFVAMAFGKPEASYNFSKEGVDNLTKAHANMGITSNDFGIVASHLKSCMEAAKVPEAMITEGMDIVGSTKSAVIGSEHNMAAEAV